jgi:hypothetical protein
MRMTDRWLVVLLLSVLAACGDGPGSSVLFSTADSVPRDTVPRDTTPPPPPPPPPDTTPPPGPAASVEAVPASQRVAVGDSGIVRAVVRDSAGREVRVTGVSFFLQDTTIVQSIGIGTNYRVFRARRAGQTRYVVRYTTFEDTAVVIVVDDTTPPPPPPPPPPAVASIVVSPKTQERVVGDSATVSATLRDSLGREVWPAEITWDVSDSSTVRIRVTGSSWIVLDALRTGSARVVARHRALADTAVVIVR